MDILVVEDNAGLRKALCETLSNEGYKVLDASNAESAERLLAKHSFRVVISDLKLPGGRDGFSVLDAAHKSEAKPAVIIITAYGSVGDAVRAMKGDATDFLEKPVDTEHLLILVKRAIREQSLIYENLLLKEELAGRSGMPRILSEDPKMQELSKAIQLAAATDVTVLLQGESGTGKELFARAIHALSPRQKGPFVAINCAAIPETLLENELFGHEKGAYTGAHDAKMGKFELAHKGTIFLDEISELHPNLQAKVLRLIEEKSFERVGGLSVRTADVRVVSATNSDLEEEVKKGRFREDLFFRINVFPAKIPPIRERRGDIILLARHFLERYGRDMRKASLSLSKEAEAVLLQYDWPGNVRELQNVMERAVILCAGEALLPEHLGISPPASGGNWLASAPLEGALKETLSAIGRAVEKEKLLRAMKKSDGSISDAAKELGIADKTLVSKLKAYGLNK